MFCGFQFLCFLHVCSWSNMPVDSAGLCWLITLSVYSHSGHLIWYLRPNLVSVLFCHQHRFTWLLITDNSSFLTQNKTCDTHLTGTESNGLGRKMTHARWNIDQYISNSVTLSTKERWIAATHLTPSRVQSLWISVWWWLFHHLKIQFLYLVW